MKNNRLSFEAIPALALMIAGCSDPADDVTSAQVGQAQNVSGANVAGKEYVIRAGSELGFVGSKVTASHEGGFKNVAGKLVVSDGKLVGPQKIEINMKSIWSDSGRLTGHLKNADFFDVETYPMSTFTATEVKSSGAKYEVTGNLEMHGVTHGITFPADIQISDDRVSVQAEFSINRQDWGISYAGRADDLIRDNVVIKLNINATSGPATAADQIDPNKSWEQANPGGGGFRGLGGGGQRPNREQMMQRFDTNGDGQLDETERAAMRAARGGGRRPPVPQ